MHATKTSIGSLIYVISKYFSKVDKHIQIKTIVHACQLYLSQNEQSELVSPQPHCSLTC